MKKNIFILTSLALIAAISCNKEEAGSETPATSVPTGGSSVEFTAIADMDATRTTLDGTAVEWISGDEIAINGFRFVTEDDGATATFKSGGEEEFVEAEEYIAIYPYSASSGSQNTVYIKENIYVSAGNIVSGEVYSVAKSTDNTLYFQNLTSMIKFQVPEFSETITEISISATEQMAGYIHFGWDASGNPEWTEASDQGNPLYEVVIRCEEGFSAGVDYYAPILPGVKTNFTVRINGYLSKVSDKQLTFTRSIIHPLGTLPAPAVSDWGIRGEHNGWGTPTTMYKESDSWSVAKNVALDGEFKFYKDDGSDGVWIGGSSPSDLNSWYGASNSNISLSDYSNADGYDIYFNEAENQYCVVLSGDEAPEVKVFTPKDGYIYLTPNSNWTTDGARFAAYFFMGNGYKWVDITAVEGQPNLYEVEIQSGYPSVILCRMNPASTANNWDTRWNQTADLTVPTDNKVHYIVPHGWWDNSGNEYWSDEF